MSKREGRMKKISTTLLIIAFFIYTNCTSYLQRVNLDNDRISCKAIFVDGSVNLNKQQKGILTTTKDSIRFECEEGIIEIPYSILVLVNSDEKRGDMLPRFPQPYEKSYEPIKTSPSVLEGLLYAGIFIAIALLVYLITKLSKNKNYITLNFTINDQMEWSILKAKAEDINRITQILTEKTAM
jgi:hypothetical protein